MSKLTQEPVNTSQESIKTSDCHSILRDRAKMFSQVRAFFEKRGVMEVDCPQITQYASVDPHIDLIEAHSPNLNERRYLITSPEYAMKRLLSEGIGDIYQLSHVFRDGEVGNRHNPEFTMIEWYRQAISYQEMIEETLAIICLFLGNLPSKQMTYRETIKQYAAVDPHTLSTHELIDLAKKMQLPLYKGIQNEGRDALLNLILSLKIEPQLGKDSLFVLTHYPASQAALAKLDEIEGENCALRFEVYYNGVELANGYDELIDYEEQKKRLIQSNNERKRLGKNPLPIDEYFLSSLKNGINECCGVAVGFDRLMMQRHKKNTISEVIPFCWKNA